VITLDIDQVIRLHEKLLKATGGLGGIRDTAMLDLWIPAFSAILIPSCVQNTLNAKRQNEHDVATKQTAI